MSQMSENCNEILAELSEVVEESFAKARQLMDEAKKLRVEETEMKVEEKDISLSYGIALNRVTEIYRNIYESELVKKEIVKNYGSTLITLAKLASNRTIDERLAEIESLRQTLGNIESSAACENHEAHN